MPELKTEAEYFRIGLIDQLETQEEISDWADTIIRNSKEIPDWALELSFAKTKSKNEVITLLNSIDGIADDMTVIRKLMIKIFEKYSAGKIDFKNAISRSYQILLRQYNILQGAYSQDVRQLYFEIMGLDDDLDHYSNEKIGNLEKIKSEYHEFVAKIVSGYGGTRK
jgi:hypothetical protein